jgi:hypothetical protein
LSPVAGFFAAAGFCCITFAMTYMSLLISSDATDHSEIYEHKEVVAVDAAGRFSMVVQAVIDAVGVLAAAAAVAALG